MRRNTKKTQSFRKESEMNKYRQLPCKTFITVGSCPYRDRCQYLHDPRILSLSAKAKSRKTNSTEKHSEEDAFFWPVMSLNSVSGVLDSSKCPHVSQNYIVPLPGTRSVGNNSTHQSDKNRGVQDSSVYSMWGHFTTFCDINCNSDVMKYPSEGLCMESMSEDVNPFGSSCRLPELVKLGNGRGREYSNSKRRVDEKLVIEENGGRGLVTDSTEHTEMDSASDYDSDDSFLSKSVSMRSDTTKSPSLCTRERAISDLSTCSTFCKTPIGTPTSLSRKRKDSADVDSDPEEDEETILEKDGFSRVLSISSPTGIAEFDGSSRPSQMSPECAEGLGLTIGAFIDLNLSPGGGRDRKARDRESDRDLLFPSAFPLVSHSTTTHTSITNTEASVFGLSDLHLHQRAMAPPGLSMAHPFATASATAAAVVKENLEKKSAFFAFPSLTDLTFDSDSVDVEERQELEREVREREERDMEIERRAVSMLNSSFMSLF